MSKIIKQICCANIYRGYQHVECGKPAKVESNEKFYCGVHDPEKMQAKRDKFIDKCHAERLSELKVEAEKLAAKAVLMHKAECFDELLLALRGVIAVADQSTVEFDKARAAIAKATGSAA